MGDDSSKRREEEEELLLLNNIINESTTNVCAVCKTETQTQKHHLSYNPELVIDVCVPYPYHVKIHQHGVGRAKSATKQEPITSIFEEKKLWLPLFTKECENEKGENVIFSKEGELLYLLICPNCGIGHFIYQLLAKDSEKRTFLRCPSCSFDIEVKLLPRSEEPRT